MPDVPRALSKEEREAIQDTKKWSKIAFYVSVASLVMAITAIIVAVLC